MVVLRPVSHSPLENAPFLLGTKTDLLRSAIQQAQQHGSRDHKSFVALLYRSGAVIYNVCNVSRVGVLYLIIFELEILSIISIHGND